MMKAVQFLIENNSSIVLELYESVILLGDFESQPPPIISDNGAWLCNKNNYSAFNTKGYSIYGNIAANIKIKFFWQYAFGLDISYYRVEILEGKEKLDYSIHGYFEAGQQNIVYALYLKEDIDLANWMQLIDENKRLNHLIMPGSHNAGIYNLSHCHVLVWAQKGFVRNQNLNIYNQLIIGTRYFDIRIDYDHKKLVSYHRQGKLGCNGEDLKSIIHECISFLKKHSAEVIIMTFSHIRNDRGKAHEIKAKIEAFINDAAFEGFIYKSSNVNINLAEIPLKACRGKMILLFDYAEYVNPNRGRFRYKDLTENEPDNKAIIEHGNFALFDKYTNTADFDKMQKDQLRKLNQYGGLGKASFFLLSWTLTAEVNFKSVVKNRNIKQLAEKANGHLAAALENQYKSEGIMPNIVYLDFLNASLTKAIVQYNFMPKTKQNNSRE